MKRFQLILIFLLVPNVWAGEFVFRDSDCKTMGPNGKTVRVLDGDKSEYTCVVVGVEASCNYKSLESGKSQGNPTKFEVIDLDGVQIWSSAETGNVKMLINEEGRSYIYGLTVIIPDKGTLISKECVGTIVRHVK